MAMKLHRFTLIELLVVMGLMGLLVSLAIPAFSRMNTGKSVNIAAEKLMRALENAQALAIAHRQYVALVIPDGTFADDDTKIFTNGTHNLASFRPAFVFDDGGNWTFENWAPQSQWSAPMENARLVAITDNLSQLPTQGIDYTGGISSVTGSLSAVNAFCNLSGLSCRGVIFSPDGGLAAPSDLFFIVQGCTVNGSSVDYTGQETNYFILHVTRLGGKISYYTKE